MRNYILPLLLLFPLFIISCSGSDTYQGKWKATDMSGTHVDINFGPKNFSITDEHGKVVTYEYTQNKIKIGRSLNIIFPIPDEKGKALIALESNQPVYTISRTAYITYSELAGLGK